MKERNTLLYVIIGLLLVIVVIRLVGLVNNMQNSANNNYLQAVSDQSNQASTSRGTQANNSSTQMPLHSLKTLSTEWGTGDGNYNDGLVDDYYGNEYTGYYDFAAIDSPYLSFKESFVRIATKGEWRYLSGTYFPRAWESGDYYVRLSVLADDDLAYRGEWMTLDSKAVSFNVDIKNCDVLKIVVDSQKTESLPYITPGIVLVNATVSR